MSLIAKKLTANNVQLAMIAMKNAKIFQVIWFCLLLIVYFL